VEWKYHVVSSKQLSWFPICWVAELWLVVSFLQQQRNSTLQLLTETETASTTCFASVRYSITGTSPRRWVTDLRGLFAKMKRQTKKLASRFWLHAFIGADFWNLLCSEWYSHFSLYQNSMVISSVGYSTARVCERWRWTFWTPFVTVIALQTVHWI